MLNQIGIGSKASDLTGIGTEYLVVNGEVIAKFYDGNMIVDAPLVDGAEVTAIAA